MSNSAKRKRRRHWQRPRCCLYKYCGFTFPQTGLPACVTHDQIVTGYCVFANGGSGGIITGESVHKIPRDRGFYAKQPKLYRLNIGQSDMRDFCYSSKKVRRIYK